MNGSAQKTRRWTKGGSLPGSPHRTLPQVAGNGTNGATTTLAPLWRNAIAEFFSGHRSDDHQMSPDHATSTVSAAVPSNRLAPSVAQMDIPAPHVAKTTQSVAQFPGWKRVLDLGFIIATCPIWIPLMTLVMLVVKIGSRGPVFYRQERVGYQRKPFMIYKFRSMKVNAETNSHERHFASLIDDNSPMTKLDTTGDPRLIPLGRLLRATGLDELPQIFNVIRGDMSLVGPRPCLPYEFQRYERWQQERVNAAPGLTGYWQVNGKNKTTFAEMIDMDIFYAKNMSLALDLTIICKTIPAILQQVREAKIRRSQIGPPPALRHTSPTLAKEREAGLANL